MANVRVSLAIRNARLDAINTALNAGAGAATIKIYTGTQAATADTAIGAQTLLGTLTCTDPAMGAAAAGVSTFATITEDSIADNGGTATWARVADSNGVTVFDCDVGTSGATINLNSVTITAGGPIRLSSGTLTDAAS